jgi:hypothetical protein
MPADYSSFNRRNCCLGWTGPVSRKRLRGSGIDRTMAGQNHKPDDETTNTVEA